MRWISLPLRVGLALAPCAAVFAAGADPTVGLGGAWIERRALAMGTRVEVVVEAADRRVAIAASEAALAAVRATETRLSTWAGDSELVRLNAAPVGTWVPLSPNTASELRDAIGWADATAGAFDPTVGALVRAWDVRGDGRIPEVAELRSARRSVGYVELELEADRARRLVDGLEVEEGGFGKGGALRRALRAARDAGARCVRVDLGGQWASAGTCDPVTISIAHPNDRDRVIGSLQWSRGSVATSGHSERRAATDDGAISHLLDPRTGRPAPDRGSATVIAADPLAADAVATALAVLGPDAGAEWMADRPEFAAVFAFSDHAGVVTLRTSCSLQGLVEPHSGVRLEFFESTCDSRTGAPRATDPFDDLSPGEGTVERP